MKAEQLHELLHQALETEQGSIAVYRTALGCALNDDLGKEWEEYLAQTTTHESIMRSVVEDFGLDPMAETPGRLVVRHTGKSFVAAMQIALSSGPPESAQLVAAECVVNAKTKDHLNWELIAAAADELSGAESKILKDACAQVEEQENEHLYHSAGGLVSFGWSRSGRRRYCRRSKSRRT